MNALNKEKMFIPERINPIIKLTEKCNYNCAFCRYANHRQVDSGTPDETVIKMIMECYKYNQERSSRNMNVIFHGGEPLLYGVERLLKILRYIETSIDENFLIEYSVQTNASLISDRWIEIFKQYNFNVGISLDGPVELNGHYGANRDTAVGEAVLTYHKMREAGVPCGFLSVITNSHLGKLDDYFEFWKNNKIESIGLCYCYNKFDGDSVDPVRLGYWLNELFDLYFNSNSKIKIREFEMIVRRVLNRPHNECTMSCREACGNYLTVTPSGLIEFCDDYDLDEGRNNSLGNINNQTLVEIITANRFQRVKNKSIEIVEKKCKGCEVFELCRCGCSRNDIKDGNFFCETFKILYPHIRDVVFDYLEKRK